MKTVTTTVKYKVPRGPYCNHTMQKSTILTRCRFCTEVKKGAYTCAMYNQPLAVVDGTLILKEDRCLRQEGVDAPDSYNLNTKDVMKHAITEYRKIYKYLIEQGAPDGLAHKTAQEEALK